MREKNNECVSSLFSSLRNENITSESKRWVKFVEN